RRSTTTSPCSDLGGSVSAPSRFCARPARVGDASGGAQVTEFGYPPQHRARGARPRLGDRVGPRPAIQGRADGSLRQEPRGLVAAAESLSGYQRSEWIEPGSFEVAAVEQVVRVEGDQTVVLGVDDVHASLLDRAHVE